MAYNGFPETYQNGYPQNNYYPYTPQYGMNQSVHTPTQGYMNPMNQMGQQQQVQQPNGMGIIWVQGEAGAKAYSNIRPDVPVALWDSEEPVIYIKSMDATGRPSMTILDYTERDLSDQKQQKVTVEYATKEQIENLNDQYSSFSGKLNELSQHITEIENRITSFGKPQQNNNNNNNRRGNK